jgi:hypothetical protein
MFERGVGRCHCPDIHCSLHANSSI